MEAEESSTLNGDSLSGGSQTPGMFLFPESRRPNLACDSSPIIPPLVKCKMALSSHDANFQTALTQTAHLRMAGCHQPHAGPSLVLMIVMKGTMFFFGSESVFLGGRGIQRGRGYALCTFPLQTSLVPVSSTCACHQKN